MSKSGSWIPVFWSAVVCNVIAAGLAVLWLKPRVARVLREETEAPSVSTHAKTIPEQVAAAEASD